MRIVADVQNVHRRVSRVVKVAQVGAAHNLPVIDLYKAMTVYPGTDEFLQADGLHFHKWAMNY